MKIEWLPEATQIAVGNGIVTTQRQWGLGYGSSLNEAALIYNDITCLYPVLTAKQGPSVCTSFASENSATCDDTASDRRVARYRFTIGTGVPPNITGVSQDTIFVSVHDVATRIRSADPDDLDKRYIVAPGATAVYGNLSNVRVGDTNGGAPYWAEPATDEDPPGGIDFTHPYETPHNEYIVTFRFDQTNTFELLYGFTNTKGVEGTVTDVNRLCITVRRDIAENSDGHAVRCPV